MDVATKGVGLICDQKPFNRPDLRKVLSRVYARERARGAVLFATVPAALLAGRVQRLAVAAQVALDRDKVFRSVDRRGERVGLQPEQIAELPTEAGLRRRCFTLARYHRDGVIRTLRGAVAAAYARLRVNIDLPQAESPYRAGRAPGQTLRVFTMHADFGRKDALVSRQARGFQPRHVNAAPRQP